MQHPATVWVQFSQIGFHRWADAPKHRAYLAQVHRHTFQVEVSTSVDHDDRDIEFHDLRDFAIAGFKGLGEGREPNFGTQSCEALARRLSLRLASHYARQFTVTVSEEGEAGATVISDPE